MVEFRSNSTVELYKSNATDLDVARAAWVSLDPDPREKESGRVAGLINYLYNEQHMSPFEHGSFTFYIETPIFVAREFMRHRTMSYNEYSLRYAEFKPVFYVPSKDRPLIQTGKVGAYTFEPGDAGQYAMLDKDVRAISYAAHGRYEELKALGIANEVARMLLPVNTFTYFMVTVNPRNLMQFLDLRNAPQALYEIRDVAYQMEQIFRQQMPATYSAWAGIRAQAE